MSVPFTHRLELNQEKIISQNPGESLALVDLDSYPAFVGPEADRLDLMVHLEEQTCALTAFTWPTLGETVQVRLVVTGNHKAMERITFSNRPPSASGTIRTHGNLALANHGRLLDSARHSTHTLLKGGGVSREQRTHRLHVPSGIYYALVYYRFAYPDGEHPGYTSPLDAPADYTVFLHHYPHPAPRVAPVRLSSSLLSWMKDDIVAGGGITSHKAPA